MNKQLRGTLLLTLTAIIWGVAFVAQSVGMDHVGPWTFICTRYILGVLVLLPVICIGTKKRLLEGKGTVLDHDIRKNTFIGGVLCGIFLFCASLFQQYGIIYTSVGKAGFITALYIIIVPILSIFLHKKIGLNEWISAVIATVGFYVMSIQGQTGVNIGDILILVCALVFSMQIMTIDRFVDKVDPVAMSCVQFFVCVILGMIGMLIIEKPDVSSIIAAGIPILYAGLLSSGAGYTLQILGQRDLPPTVASLLMSLESVFSALAGFVILHQTLSVRELIGCALVFAGVILAQIKRDNK